MILCSRCDFVGHVTGLLEHHDAVHGGWSVRYFETVQVKPMEPDPSAKPSTHRINLRGLRKLQGVEIIDLGVAS